MLNFIIDSITPSISFISNYAYSFFVVTEEMRGYVARQARDACYYKMDDVGACERAGHVAYENAISGYGIHVAVVGAVTIVTGAVHVVNNIWGEHQKHQYNEKKPEDIQNLSKGQIQSFSKGVAASKSRVNKLASCFDYSACRHLHAYYAGFQAGKTKDTELMGKIIRPASVLSNRRT